ncbi:hypothetical protein G6O67_005071 [Ophiocordyceps sinensis]|uniref:Uncharacterized protein n=1 Tax=Ophiocordyceps sinensis TaxID=72228 RepID=A0A8H4V5J7_9HYPO|nr:hypothetical protein G6O67_005071 [Ophiocordyceps sinensis]
MEEEAPPSPPSPPSPPCYRPVSPLSISQLVRLYCRERLLVRPTHWTDRHLELLGCSFGKPSQAPATAPSVLFGKLGSGLLRRAFGYSEWRLLPRENALDGLLTMDGPCDKRPNLRFTFNRRPVQTLRCTVFFPKIQRAPDVLPSIVAARVDIARISEFRDDLFMLPEKWEGYRSARSLSILQKKKITPKNRLHDPYLLGTLISIAQENKARAAVRKELPEPRFLSQLLVSSDNEKELYLYKAYIPSSLLCSLDDPASIPLEPASIPVDITAIRYSPYRSFRDRLTTLVLPEDDLARLRAAQGKDGLLCQSTQPDAEQATACS